MPDHDEKVVGEPGDMLGQALKNLNKRTKMKNSKGSRQAR